jgi:hypothetical protein
MWLSFAFAAAGLGRGVLKVLVSAGADRLIVPS